MAPSVVANWKPVTAAKSIEPSGRVRQVMSGPDREAEPGGGYHSYDPHHNESEATALSHAVSSRIASISSGSGRCSAFDSSHGARIQTSRSSSVVRITGMAFG